jgi:hypothetical protein
MTISKTAMLTIAFILVNTTTLLSQNVGIGVNAPAAGLHIISNNGLIASGVLNEGNTINQNGAGSKLIFNSKKVLLGLVTLIRPALIFGMTFQPGYFLLEWATIRKRPAAIR